MDPVQTQSRPGGQAPRVLVVDDDRRVRELLEIALTASGFAVISAADGDEALRQAQAERPDLVVLDVRLPKKNGFDVCDALRHDPADPGVPIILVSAAAEIDQRLLAFTRGADDYMAKPFSPKELVARIRRLLVRAAEARGATHRLHELERELASARREARCAAEEARREQRLRDLATGPGRDLLRSLDLDDAATRLLLAVQSGLGTGSVALLLPAGETLAPWGIAGDRFARIARVTLPAAGEIATLLLGLRRPVTRLELERLIEARAELAPLVTGRWALVAPLAGPTGLEGLLLAEERADGADFTRADGEGLAVLCGDAALALRNAARVRAQARLLLEVAAERVYRTGRAEEALAATQALLDHCAPALDLPPGWREVIAHALAVADVAGEADRGPALGHLRAHDASGLVRAVEALTARALASSPLLDADADDPRPAVLLRTLLAYMRARARGAKPEAAIARAAEFAAEDPAVAQALVAAAAEDAPRAHRAA